ncbi:Phage virion morphogenesis protein [Azospirillaceae bacterium]
MDQIKSDLLTEAEEVVSTAAEALAVRLNDQVETAGLGERLSQTWKSKVKAVPTGARAEIYSKAPKIMQGFDEGATIVACNGSFWLAIPTEHVPRRSGRGLGRKLSPVDVEALYNRDLRYIPGHPGKSAYLVMDFLVSARSGTGWRAATVGRLAQGRRAQSVLMFVLIPQVTLEKRLDIAGAFAEAASDFPDLTITKE